MISGNLEIQSTKGELAQIAQILISSSSTQESNLSSTNIDKLNTTLGNLIDYYTLLINEATTSS